MTDKLSTTAPAASDTSLPQHLRQLSSIGVLLMDESGLVIDCNDGARSLLTLPTDIALPFDVHGVIVRPGIDEILSAGPGFTGRLTVGSWTGVSRSLFARLESTSLGLILTVERDYAALERNSEHLTNLTRELIISQRRSLKLAEELRRSEDRFRSLALVDDLTGLSNRRYFDTAFEQAVSETRPVPNRSLVLLLIDLDNFKTINDSHGHHAGDVVLGQLGRMINANIRSGEVGARIGGDEMAIVLRDTDATVGHRVATRLQQALGSHAWEWPITVHMSIGIAEMRPGEDAATLLAAADEALYAAKHAGRNRAAVRESIY